MGVPDPDHITLDEVLTWEAERKRLRTAAALSLVLNAALIMALAGVAWSWVIVPAVTP